MLQSRLLSLFRDFNKDELRRFEAFLLSPYFNQSDKMIRFFRLIAPHHPLYESRKLEKEKVYKALHGSEAYNDVTMRKLISDLFKLTKTFLAHEGLRQNEIQASTNRYNWLMAHKNEKLVEAELEYRKDILDAYVPHDMNYYQQNWRYELDSFDAAVEKYQGTEEKLLKNFDLWSPVHAHNRNYLMDCFWLDLYLLNLARIYKFPMDEALLDSVETLAGLYVGKGDALIDICFNILRLMRRREEQYFFSLKAQLSEADDSIPYSILQQAGIAMGNFCTKQIQQGEDRFAHEMMDLYLMELKNEWPIKNGEMSYSYYINIAIRGMETISPDWAADFAEKYKQYLNTEYRENVFSYVRAHILFERGRYKEALRLALSCDLPIFLGKISIRLLIVRTHYELDMMDEIHVELDALKRHLKDWKVSYERRFFFQAFCTMTQQLCELKSNYNLKKNFELAAEMEINKAVPNRRWFLQKINELRKT